MVLLSEQVYGDQEQEWVWMPLHNLSQTFPKVLAWA